MVIGVSERIQENWNLLVGFKASNQASSELLRYRTGISRFSMKLLKTETQKGKNPIYP